MKKERREEVIRNYKPYRITYSQLLKKVEARKHNERKKYIMSGLVKKEKTQGIATGLLAQAFVTQVENAEMSGKLIPQGEDAFDIMERYSVDNV